MLSEFQCGVCGAKSVVAFSMEPEPGKPIRHCVVCGSLDLTFIRSVNEKQLEEELEKERGGVKPAAIDVQWGIRYCFEVGQKVLVREGTRWVTRTIKKITVLRNEVSCPRCNMPVLGEPRFWFSDYGNVPISEVMAKEDIDARLRPEPLVPPMIGRPIE